MYNMPTLEQVRAMVANRPASITLAELCAKTDVSESWMDKFLAGKIANPGYKHLYAIVKTLTIN